MARATLIINAQESNFNVTPINIEVSSLGGDVEVTIISGEGFRITTDSSLYYYEIRGSNNLSKLLISVPRNTTDEEKVYKVTINDNASGRYSIVTITQSVANIGIVRAIKISDMIPSSIINIGNYSLEPSNNGTKVYEHGKLRDSIDIAGDNPGVFVFRPITNTSYLELDLFKLSIDGGGKFYIAILSDNKHEYKNIWPHSSEVLADNGTTLSGIYCTLTEFVLPANIEVNAELDVVGKVNSITKSLKLTIKGAKNYDPIDFKIILNILVEPQPSHDPFLEKYKSDEKPITTTGTVSVDLLNLLDDDKVNKENSSIIFEQAISNINSVIPSGLFEDNFGSVDELILALNTKLSELGNGTLPNPEVPQIPRSSEDEESESYIKFSGKYHKYSIDELVAYLVNNVGVSLVYSEDDDLLIGSKVYGISLDIEKDNRVAKYEELSHRVLPSFNGKVVNSFMLSKGHLLFSKITIPLKLSEMNISYKKEVLPHLPTIAARCIHLNSGLGEPLEKSRLELVGVTLNNYEKGYDGLEKAFFGLLNKKVRPKGKNFGYSFNVKIREKSNEELPWPKTS